MSELTMLEQVLMADNAGPNPSEMLTALKVAPFDGQAWLSSRPTARAEVFRTASLALAAGVDIASKALGHKQPEVWLPGYFAYDSLGPLQHLNVRIRLYPITEDLAPDWTCLESWAEQAEGQAVMTLVHYFGFPGPVTKARAFCDRYNLALLEDCAHVVCPSGLIGSQGDLQAYSPRKVLMLPEGGLLVMPSPWQQYLPVGGTSASVVKTITWMARQIGKRATVKLGQGRILSRKMATTSDTASVAVDEGERLDGIARCDSLAMRMLAARSIDLASVGEKRRRNFKLLANSLVDIPGARPLFPNLIDDVYPYAFPLCVEGGARPLALALNEAGIPAGRWTIVPPEVAAGGSEFDLTRRLLTEVVALPLHQGLDDDDIDAMSAHVRKTLQTLVH